MRKGSVARSGIHHPLRGSDRVGSTLVASDRRQQAKLRPWGKVKSEALADRQLWTELR